VSAAGLLSIYWIVVILGIYGITAAYYGRRGAIVGLAVEVWPAIASGVVVLGGMVAASFWLPPSAVAIGGNGVEPLIVVACTLGVLAVTERNWSMAIFVVGFALLVAVSLFYDDVNAFERLGIGGWFAGGALLVPNLLVPGVYLLVGGILLWRPVARPRAADATGDDGARDGRWR
jgi:hypothetical protein